MISFMPEIYPDELCFSWFSRYFVHSGCLTSTTAFRDLYRKRSDTASKEFIGNLNAEAKERIAEIIPLRDLILHHTLYKQYARFIPLDRKINALKQLEFDYTDIHYLFAVLPRDSPDKYIKYCPLCADEDRRQYGECYFHASQQLRGLTVCYKHNCMLEETPITAKSEQSFTFSPAEEFATIRTARANGNEKLRQYAEYITAAFNAPMEFSKDIPISSVLYHKMLGTPYISATQRVRKTQLFAEDLRHFYEDIGISNIATMSQIQRVWGGDRFDFSVVCQIAFYLGMSIQELTAPSLTAEQIQAEQSTHYMKDRQPLDWGEYDGEIAPLLEQLAIDIYSGKARTDGKPMRVSEKLVYRELELSAHRLEKMPLCRAILQRYSEPYGSTFARQLVWGYNKLKAAGKPFYWSDLRAITSVKKRNAKQIKPYIPLYTDKRTATAIMRLLE